MLLVTASVGFSYLSYLGPRYMSKGKGAGCNETVKLQVLNMEGKEIKMK